MLNWKKANVKEDFVSEGTVLIVDDEEPNLRLLEAILSKKYKVITANSAQEALEKMKEKDLGVIVSDQRMPDMSGTELFEAMEKQHHPALRIILTGYADIQTVVEAINSGKVFRFMSKPVEKSDFVQTVHSAMAQFHITQTNLRLLSQIKRVMEDNATLSKQVQLYGGAKIESSNEFLSFNKAQMIKLSILNIDLRGYSIYSRDKNPEQVIGTLQEVYEPIYNLIHEFGGIVDKHMGDGLMALFGLNGESGLEAGITSLEKIVDLFPSIKNNLTDPSAKLLKMGMGLASGEVIMGMLGDATRYELAVIGQAANLSARLQEYSKSILAGRSTLTNFNHIIGITSVNDYTLPPNFTDIYLQEGESIRDFEEIRKLSILYN
jgi:FixJ family two-component response regulator/class 3 adenylate cyclase